MKQLDEQVQNIVSHIISKKLKQILDGSLSICKSSIEKGKGSHLTKLKK
jgi:hypothetical protein